MAPESNNKKNKSDQVAEAILEKIASGEWPTDCKMPTEKELSESFGVSRVSVRQAISQLTGQGVLRVVQGGGTYVNKVLPKDYLNNVLQMVVMDDPDYLEIQEFRLLLEPMIAHYAAAKATPEAIDEMRQCIERQQAAETRGDMTEFLNEDTLFHNLLASSVRNSLITKVMSLAHDLLDLGMQHTARISGYEDGVRYHKVILEQLANHDSEGARAVMWCHIQSNITIFKKKQSQ